MIFSLFPRHIHVTHARIKQTKQLKLLENVAMYMGRKALSKCMQAYHSTQLYVQSKNTLWANSVRTQRALGDHLEITQISPREHSEITQRTLR